MARARIELMNSLSWTGRGRTFKKGSPQILIDIADIRFFQSQPGFRVLILDDTIKKTKPVLPVVEEIVDEYTEQNLEAMLKVDLIALAHEFGIELEGNERKAEIVKLILENK